MQNNLSERKNLMTIGEASEYLGVSIDTLRRWERKGRIEPYRSPGGHRHFAKDELDKLFDKKYVRDEPTVRRSLGEKKTAKSPVEEITEEIPPVQNLTPVIGIPAWRAINLPEENDEEVIQETTPPTPAEPIILDRPSRAVNIPQNLPLKIISERKEELLLTPQEAYFRQQSYSVLAPSKTELLNPPTPQATAKSQSPGLSQFIKENRKTIIYASLFVGILILSVTWYLAWSASQRVLSPVP